MKIRIASIDPLDSRRYVSRRWKAGRQGVWKNALKRSQF